MWLVVIGVVILFACCVSHARSVGTDYDDGYEDAHDFFERK